MCKGHSILYLTLQGIVFFYLGLQGIIFFYPINYYLSTAVCPPGFSDPLLWARCVHGPAAAFNVYKSSPTPLLDHLPLQSSPNTPRSAVWPRHAPSTPSHRDPLRTPLRRPCRSWKPWRHGGLKPESSICHSGFDALDCRDDDHSSR